MLRGLVGGRCSAERLGGSGLAVLTLAEVAGGACSAGAEIEKNKRRQRTDKTERPGVVLGVAPC